MKNVCGVDDRDPEKQIIHSIGSKAALSILPDCFINPGDVALMTTPGYPVFGTHAKYLGGEVHNIPLLEKNGFLPDLDSIPADVLKRAKTLVINYPNNPTGASATPEFFAKVVAFAKKHNIVVVPRRGLRRPGLRRQAAQLPRDAGRDGRRRRAALDVQGLQHDRLAARVRRRQPADRQGLRRREGQHRLRPVPRDPAGLRLLPSITPSRRSRSPPSTAAGWTASSQVLNKHGFNAEEAARLVLPLREGPEGRDRQDDGKRVAFEKGEAFSQWMITEKLISTVPWDDAGAYVRFSVTFIAKDEADEQRVLGEIDKRLAGSTFEF